MLTAVLLAALAACAPVLRPIVAEVFYDATGDDTGLEFVELYNPTAAACPLLGARLEAGDGAGPGRWTLRWTGTAADTVAALGRFVIGGARVSPAPQVTVELGLQNGPDALRIVWPDGASEVVGYGPLAYPEYYCGAPAADVPSGQSLARVPDGADLGGNALDFRAAAPSPGRANQPSRDLALVAGSLRLDPEQPAAFAPAALWGVVINRGGEPIAAGEATLTVTASGLVAVARPLARALAPGDTASYGLPLQGLSAGTPWLVARVALAGDQAGENDADSLRARVGPGPLGVTEIQFHPGAGEGEWVEVRAREPAVDPAAFTISDRGAARGIPSGGGGPLDPDSLAILAQDRAALLARYPGLDPGRVWQAAPWPALNNSDDSTGHADAVVLDGAWGPALDPDGSPLAPPRRPPAVHAGFEVTPRRAPAGATLEIAWTLPWPTGRVAVEIFDLGGRRVARPVPEHEAARSGRRRWELGTLAPGVYVVALAASDRGRSASLVETRALRVTGLAP